MPDPTEHPLGREAIGRLLLQYSAPAIVGQTALSLYNIIAAIFIGNMGKAEGALALAGLAVTFPIMNLTLAFGLLVGLGGAAVSSMRLGEGRAEDAAQAVGNILTLSVLCGFLFACLSLLFLDPVLRLFGASEASLPYAHDFMRVFLLTLPLTYPTFNLNHAMRATGYPRKAMCSLLLTVLLNIPLAWLFILKFRWGMTGAALSSSVAQLAASTWVMAHFVQRSSLVHFQRAAFRLRARTVGTIFSIGMPPFLLNICGCVVVALINRRLAVYGGDLAVSAYGILNRVLFFVAMVVVGITQGMQPIAGYNFGARQMNRVRRVLWLAIFAATGVTALGSLLIELLPWPISRLFTDNEELLQLTVTAMRLCTLLFALAGSQIVIASFFQAIGQVRISVFLTTTRQMIFLVPALIVMPMFFGLNGVWLSIPVADALAEFVTVAMLIYYIRRTTRTTGKQTKAHVPS